MGFKRTRKRIKVPEFRTTIAMQKINVKEHLMTGEDFEEAIVRGFVLF